MFPIPNDVGDNVAMLNNGNMFDQDLSDQEIDVITADDELIPDDEHFQDGQHVYEERVVYEEDEIEYDEMNPEVQQFMANAFEPDTHPQYDHGVIMSKEEYEAHYLNTDEHFLIERQEDTLYNMLENPANIIPIPKETRLGKYPEMRMMLPTRRPTKASKEFTSETKTAGEGVKKHIPAPSHLLVGNNNFRETKKDQFGNLTEEVKDVQLIAKPKNKSAGTEDKGSQKTTTPTIVTSSKPAYIGNAALVAAPTAKGATLEVKKKAKVQTRKIYKPPPIERPEKKHEFNTFPLTPLPDRFFFKRCTITAEQAGFTSDCVSCDLCEMMFRNSSLHESHRKNHSKGDDNAHRGMGLLCPMPNCSQRADTIATIVKHMKLAHNITDIPFEYITFRSLPEFKMWRIELERLTMSRFSRASGKTNIFSKSTYYQCQHSGIVPSTMKTAEELRKARSRMSKKLGKTCTAFFHIREADDGTVTLRGCTKHTGHGVDVRQLPLSDEIKLEIASCLIRGYDETFICDKMRLESANTNRKFYLQPYEVRNVANKIERFKEDFKKRLAAGEVTDLADYMRKRMSQSKANTACRTMPGPEDEVETVYDVTSIYPDSYFVEPVFDEEIVIEDGQFNIPSGNITIDGGHVAPKIEVSPPPNENLNTVSSVQGNILDVQKSDGVQETPRKRNQLDSEEEPSTSAPQPTRYSSRLMKKKSRSDIKVDEEDLHYQNSYQDSQLVGDDADYSVETD